MKKTDLNVLIVEDDKSLSAALSEGVKRLGYRPIVVVKPDEAESIVKIKPIHALVVDCMLPGKNGVDLVVKLKENLIEGTAVIFTSGIYRDKIYAQEAIRKTEALEFLAKPFDMEHLLRLIDKALSAYVETPKVDLHTLLATPYAGQRDRRKALDHVEDLCGYDLPFVFCILMDSESSGHLNIVDANQNIFGVTFAKGALVRVDSEDTVLLTKKTLLRHGFITEQELSEVKTKTGDIIKALVAEGLMSPHAESVIRIETLVHEVNKLISEGKIKANFVPDRKVKGDENGINVQAFLPQLHDMIVNMVPVAWLKRFYAVWNGHTIRLGPQWSDTNEVSNFVLIKQIEAVIPLLRKDSSLEEILTQSSLPEDIMYKGLHLLALRRLVVFEETKRVRNLDEHVNRLKLMHAAVVGKPPEQILVYFGLGSTPKPADVTKFFKEFAKANHPDTLPQAVSEEVRKLNHELFGAVTAAHDILTNEEKREKYLSTKRQAEAELQLRSDELVSAGHLLLTRGRYADALKILEQANDIFSSDRSFLHLLWAKLKVENSLKAGETVGIQKRLSGMVKDSQRNPTFLYVMGLMDKSSGNNSGAKEYFEKALKVDERFMDARRDLTTISADDKKNVDILNGDISVVISNIFKKKKGA